MLDTVNSERAASVEERFYEFVQEIKRVIPKSAIGWVESLRFEWINNPSVNAVAFITEKYSTVGFYTGVMDHLWYAFLALMHYPVSFQLPKGEEWSREMSVNPYHAKEIIQLILGRQTLSSSAIEKLLLFSSNNSQRSQYADHLYTLCVDFMLMHEIHHFWCGHIFYSDQLKKSGFILSATPMSDLVDVEVRKVFEIHADQYAIKRLLNYYDPFPVHDRLAFCSDWLTALAVLITTTSPLPEHYLEWSNPKYPHPHIRFYHLVLASEHYMKKNFAFTSEEWDEIINVLMYNIAAIEVLGGGLIVPPFKDAFNNQKRSSAELERSMRLLGIYLPQLEKARENMCAFFAY